MFKVIISEANDAFAEAPASEIAAILRGLADRLEEEGIPQEAEGGQFNLLDFNGNYVGFARSEPEGGEA